MSTSKNNNIFWLVKCVLCKMLTEGYVNLSIKDEDIIDYLPKLQKILDMYSISYDTEIFKISDEGKYDKFKSFITNEVNNSDDIKIMDERIVPKFSRYFVESTLYTNEGHKNIIDFVCFLFYDELCFDSINLEIPNENYSLDIDLCIVKNKDKDINIDMIKNNVVKKLRYLEDKNDIVQIVTYIRTALAHLDDFTFNVTVKNNDNYKAVSIHNDELLTYKDCDANGVIADYSHYRGMELIDEKEGEEYCNWFHNINVTHYELANMKEINRLHFYYLIDYIMCKMVKEGKYRLSVKNDDLSIYAPKMKKMLDDNFVKYEVEMFCKTPVSETYDYFRNYMLDYLFSNRIGIMIDNNEFLLEIGECIAEYHLMKNKQYADVIEEGYLIFSDQTDLEIDLEKEKRLQLVKMENN